MKITYMGVEMTVEIGEYGIESIQIGFEECTDLLEHHHSEIINECIRQERNNNCDVEAFL